MNPNDIGQLKSDVAALTAAGGASVSGNPRAAISEARPAIRSAVASG